MTLSYRLVPKHLTLPTMSAAKYEASNDIDAYLVDCKLSNLQKFYLVKFRICSMKKYSSFYKPVKLKNSLIRCLTCAIIKILR